MSIILELGTFGHILVAAVMKVPEREHRHQIEDRIISLVLRFARSLSRFETQDIKTQPQINHYEGAVAARKGKRTALLRIWGEPA